MILIAAVCGAGAALRLVLVAAPRRANTVELAAAGWPPDRLRSASITATSLVAAVVLAAGTLLAGYRSGALAAVAVSVWVPAAAPLLLRVTVLSGYRARRDAALLEWLRRIRLYVAAGRPINDAAVTAAERVEAPAFAPAATSINLALASGADPLSAASVHFAGSAAETLVGTLAAAERGGAVDPRVGHVVAVADPGHAEVAQCVRAELLGRREEVGHDLTGVQQVGESVDDGNRGLAGELVHLVLVVGADENRVDVAAQHPGRVGDGLAAPDLGVAVRNHDRVAPELGHPRFGAHPGSGRALAEDHRQGAAHERAAADLPGLHRLGEPDERPQLGGGQQGEVDEVPLGGGRPHRM